MATAQLIDDTSYGFEESLEATQTGFVGYRHYKVDSRDLLEGLSAANMPRVGDPWDPAFVQLKVTGVRPVERGGAIGQTDRGYAIWRVDYATREAQILDPTGEPWTELDLGTVQVTVYQGVDETGEPSGESIVGGAPREVGTLAANVYTYRPSSAGVPLSAWLPLQNFTNSEALTLPSVQRTGVVLNLGVGEALYLGVQAVREVGASLEYSHRFQLAPDFLHRETRTNDAGEVVGDRTVRIYGEADLRQVVA